MIRTTHANALICGQTLLVLYVVNLFNQGRERVVLLLCRNALAVIFQKIMAAQDEAIIQDQLVNGFQNDSWKCWIEKEARRRLLNFAWSM